MLEGSEESSDSGCEADSLLPPETEEADAARTRRRAEENGPFSLDKALGFVDFDSNDFDEVRENKKKVSFFYNPTSFFTSPSLFLCIRRSATAGIIIILFLLPSSALPTPLLSCLAQLGEQHRRWSVTTLSLSRYTHLH